MPLALAIIGLLEALFQTTPEILDHIEGWTQQKRASLAAAVQQADAKNRTALEKSIP